jgi:hypothetical protein
MIPAAAVAGEFPDEPILTLAVALIVGATCTAIANPLTTGRLRPTRLSGQPRMRFRVQHLVLMFIAVALGFITGSLLVAFALALVGSLFLLVRAFEHPGAEDAITTRR